MQRNNDSHSQIYEYISLVSFHLQAAAGGSEGTQGSTEDECGDEESEDSDESEGDDLDDEENKEEEEEEESEPLSLKWPDTRRKQATYLFLLPIVFPLWLTLPDVRNLVRSNHIFNLSHLTHIYFYTSQSRVLCFFLHFVWHYSCSRISRHAFGYITKALVFVEEKPNK